MSEHRTCPITGQMADYEPAGATSVGHRLRQCGSVLVIAEGAYVALQGRLWGKCVTHLSPSELNPARALLRSKFWRSVRERSRPLLVITRHQLSGFESAGGWEDQLAAHHIVLLEDAISEADSLTFAEKALNTLENLYDEWKRTGKVPEMTCASLDDQGRSWYHERQGQLEDGMAYGCDERTAPHVYQWLADQGFLIDRIVSGHCSQRELTPAALIEAEKIKAGREASINRGFFIRRFDPETDAFYRPILDEVRNKTGCDISPVWERQKNEKLDELILRRIRESSVIVLDVTGERFNVGLEAGYALALRKQIIVLRDKAEKDGDLPFDIRTMNCFFYDRGEPEKLQEKLTERVLDALEEARLGTH